MTSCIIIGARGFIGSAVAAEARARGLDCIEVTRDNYAELKGASADVLINAGGNSRKFIDEREPEKGFELSVTSVMRLLQDFRAKKFIHLSSGAIYPDEGDPARNGEDTELDPGTMTRYGFHKWLAEQLVRHYAADYSLIRMGGFVGPGLKKNAVYDILSGGPLFVHPDSTFQYMDTRDFARIVFDLAKGKIADTPLLNISARGTISVRAAAELAGRTLPDDVHEHPVVRAELKVDKAASMVKLPTTMETVQTFIKQVQSGEVALA
jgi:nucleoside-diphosphate-sugar epimerase